MDRHDDTPPEGMRIPRDTPARTMTPVDEEMVSYLASTPPPPMVIEAKARFIHGRIRQEMQSGSWELDQLLGETRQIVIEAAAKKIAEERAERERERIETAHQHEIDKLEARIARAAEKAEERNEKDRDARRRLIAEIAAALVVAAVIWVSSVLVAASHHAP